MSSLGFCEATVFLLC